MAKHFPYPKSSTRGKRLFELAAEIRSITHDIHKDIRLGADPADAFDDGRHVAELILSAQLLERHVQ